MLMAVACRVLHIAFNLSYSAVQGRTSVLSHGTHHIVVAPLRSCPVHGKDHGFSSGSTCHVGHCATPVQREPTHSVNNFATPSDGASFGLPQQVSGSMALSSDWSNGNQISVSLHFLSCAISSADSIWVSQQALDVHNAAQSPTNGIHQSFYSQRSASCICNGRLVDSIIWHDSECELHTQTDTNILCTLQCQTVKKPF